MSQTHEFGPYKYMLMLDVFVSELIQLIELYSIIVYLLFLCLMSHK